jgi:CDP-diglyceride synthetase
VFPSSSQEAAAAADATDDDDLDEIEITPVRPALSVAIAVFAGLVGIGLIFGAQSSSPGARVPFALVLVGVQLLYVLAWLMATRPPVPWVMGGICLVVAGWSDLHAVRAVEPGLGTLALIALSGVAVAVGAQAVRADDRRRISESLRATLLLVVGVVAIASLIMLSREPLGTQVIFLSVTASAVALAVARIADAVYAKPRLAPQVPRGASGVIFGAMVGTLLSAVLGSYLYSFSPSSAAIVGLVTATAAVLADLAADYAEAGRQMAGDPPTLWVARHMQGPLGGFALAAPAAYVMTVLFLT